MGAVVFLFTHGRTRHIARGVGPGRSASKAYCGMWGHTDDVMVERTRRHLAGDRDLLRVIDRRRAQPVCKRCEQLAAKDANHEARTA